MANQEYQPIYIGEDSMKFLKCLISASLIDGILICGIYLIGGGLKSLGVMFATSFLGAGTKGPVFSLGGAV